MWHDPDDRLQKAIERFEEDDIETAWRMLRGLERKGVESPRLELYLGHCHLELDRPEAADPPLPARRSGSRPAARRAMGRARAGVRPTRPPAPGLLGVPASGAAGARASRRRTANSSTATCCSGRWIGPSRAARRVEALDPTCPHVHRHLAIGHFVAGRYGEALASWRRVEARDPDHPDAATGIGRCLARLRRTGEARASFQRALARDPRDAGARLGLGDLAADDRRAEEAIEHYRAALEADPADPDARERLAEALLEAGQPESALETLVRASSGADDGEGATPSIIAIEARALRDLGRRATALALLRSTAEASPASAEAWCSLGEFLLEEGRARAAIAPLRRALRLDGETPTPARLLARALGRVGRRKEAVSVVASAGRRHPRDPQVHLDVAAALLARERPAAAERALLRGLSWQPDGADLWTALAEIAQAGGRFPEARGRLRAALRRDRRHPRALSLLVGWLVERKQWRRAANAGRAATRVVAAGDSAVRGLGFALLRLGRPREAIAPLRRYVLAVPEDADGYRLLAEALDSIGDPEGAAAQRRLANAVASAA